MRDQGHFKEWARGLFSNTAAPITALSILVFAVTGIVWLIGHTNHFPAGYWPWMLALAFLFFTVACFLTAQTFLRQRDGAILRRDEVLDLSRYGLRFLYVSSTRLSIDPASSNCVLPLQFTLHFENVSNSPIEYQIVFAAFTIGNHTSEPIDADNGVILTARSSQGHRCGLISGVPIDQLALTASGEYVIRYGHPIGGLRFETHHQFDIQPDAFDANALPQRWEWVSRFGPTYERLAAITTQESQS